MRDFLLAVFGFAFASMGTQPTGGSGGSPPPGEWILQDGTWNDSGVWVDTATWNDGA